MKQHPAHVAALFCLFMTILIFSSPVLADAPKNRVLILPLTIHAEKDTAFLDQGIMAMMTARISQSATVIRGSSASGETDPTAKGRELDADYVVSGSITLLGGTVSTDVALTRIDTGRAALAYNHLGQSEGDILKDIDHFSNQAAQYLAALPAQASPTPAPTVVIPPPSTAARAQGLDDAPKTPLPQEQTRQAAKQLWTSKAFKGTISALSIGDMDGDGKTDIVVVHEKQILVQKKNGHQLQGLGTYHAGRNHTIIAVDAADIDGNHRDEILVTRLDAHGSLDALVLEWNGSSLAPVASGLHWYFRVTADCEKGLVLMGQRRGVPSATDTGDLYRHPNFLPGIFELVWTGNDYQAGRRLPLPADLNLYQLACGNVFNDGQKQFIAYSADDKLRVFDPSGDVRWSGEETLGGNPVYLQTPSSTDSRTQDRTYLSQRLIVADLDGDKRDEVLTVHNRDAAKGVVERFRKYTRGQLIALRWNQVNMKTIWRGEEVSGYISDFALADINGDGRREVVYALVSGGSVMQARTSKIVVESFADLL